MVQCLDMHVRDFHELIVGQIGEQHMARKGEIRAIQLQIQTSRYDGLIFFFHRVSQRGQISLARRVEIILQKQGNHSGAGGVHKSALDPVFDHRGLEIVDVLLQFALSLRAYLAHAHGPRILGRSTVIRQTLQKARKHLEVCRRVARTVTCKTGIAVLHISSIRDF